MPFGNRHAHHPLIRGCTSPILRVGNQYLDGCPELLRHLIGRADNVIRMANLLARLLVLRLAVGWRSR